jgi:lactoylglutathione lyase
MLPIRGVYEVAIRVKDLAKAEPFYREALDLEVGIRDEKRNWLFLRAGGDAGMVVLQEDKAEWPLQYFAFTLDEADIERAASMLRERGVEVEGPVFHQWMNSTSLYFDDPDGNQLELIAVHSHSGSADKAAR